MTSNPCTISIPTKKPVQQTTPIFNVLAVAGAAAVDEAAGAVEETGCAAGAAVEAGCEDGALLAVAWVDEEQAPETSRARSMVTNKPIKIVFFISLSYFYYF